MKVRIPNITAERSDRCIYCGVKNDLTDEHIVPFGLWGRLLYPDASCKECAAAINVFETQVQQKHLGGFRQRTKIPLRKRRRRDYKFQLSFATTDPILRPPPAPIEISGDEVPRQMLLLRFLPPHILTGPWPRQPEIWMYHDTNDWKRMTAKYGSHGIFMGAYDNNMFCRLIAKIGHSYTLAFMDPKIMASFDLLATDLILKGDSNPHYLIGGDLDVPPATDWMHELEVCNAVKDKTEYLFARVRLFACLGTPRYHAVIASRPRGATTVTKDPVLL